MEARLLAAITAASLQTLAGRVSQEEALAVQDRRLICAVMMQKINAEQATA